MNGASFGNRAFVAVTELSSYWIKVGPQSSNWCPDEKRKFGHGDMKSGEYRVTADRDKSDVFIDQRMMGVAGSPWKLGKGCGTDALLWPQGECGPATPSCQTSSLRAEGVHFCCFKLLVCGRLLQQPQNVTSEANSSLYVLLSPQPGLAAQEIRD